MNETKISPYKYAYAIFLNGKFIETVFLDKLLLNFEVKELLMLKGYDSNISVSFSELLNRNADRIKERSNGNGQKNNLEK